MGNVTGHGVPGELVDLIEREMARWQVPGAAVAIRDRDELLCQGFGVTSLETGQPVTPATVFRVASITKVLTATLIMTLVEEGRLDLDEPVVRYVPDVPLADAAARRVLALRHLLSHTGGIEGDRYTDTGMGDDALARYVGRFGDLRQISAPGELWSYCNAGYALAGHVVATILRQPFERILRERVIQPLGLERTVLFPHDAMVYPVVVGHAVTEGAVTIQRSQAYWRAMAPAGGIFATVLDLMRFAMFHMGDIGDGTVDGRSLMSGRSLRAMREPQIRLAHPAEAWGIGWAIRTLEGGQVVEHMGDWAGQQALLSVAPDDDFAIAVLTNCGEGRGLNQAVVDWVLGHYRGMRRVEPDIIPLSVAEFATFAGEYRHLYVPEDRVSVAMDGGGLRVTFDIPGASTSLPPLPLGPIGTRAFIVTDGPDRGEVVDFIPGSDGSPHRIRVYGRLAERAETGAV